MPTKKRKQVLPVLLTVLFLLFFFSFKGSPTGNATEDIVILGEEVITWEIPLEEVAEETADETTETETSEEGEAAAETGTTTTEMSEEEVVEEAATEEEIVEEVSADLTEEEVAELELEDVAVAEETQEEQPETITVAAFMEDATKSPNNVVVVIGENAPTGALIIALQLAGKYGFSVVKDNTIDELSSLHAIALGPASINSVSAAALEQGAVASDEGAYFLYENTEADSAVLVVAGETPKETKKAVKELLKY